MLKGTIINNNNNIIATALISLVSGIILGASVVACLPKQNKKSEATQVVDDDLDNNNKTNNNKNNNDEDAYQVVISLPDWAKHKQAEHYYTRTYVTDEDMMALAIELSAKNLQEETGGPFGCAIFLEEEASEVEGEGEGESKSNKTTKQISLVSIGMNLVVTLGNSTLHGETVAIKFAQQKVQTHQLAASSDNKKRYILVTSCEPCCMCLGAILWSGVSRIVCGATKDDATAIGFDEGPVYESSYEHLERAGIQVTRKVLQNEAAAVLQKYGKTEGAVIYNR